MSNHFSSNMTFVWISTIIGIGIGILPWFMFGPETFWERLFMFIAEVVWFGILGIVWFVINAIADSAS